MNDQTNSGECDNIARVSNTTIVTGHEGAKEDLHIDGYNDTPNNGWTSARAGMALF